MHRILLKVMLLSMSVITAVSCTRDDGRWTALSPRPLFIRNIPDDPSDYSEGFRGGCNDSMGLSGYGGLRLHEVRIERGSLRYKYFYDANRALEDKQYQLGYRHGYFYCGVAANAVIGF